MTRRVAVVTGGTGGLGLAICQRLLAAGRTVVAVDLGGNADAAARFDAVFAGTDCRFVACDVADPVHCGTGMQRIAEEFGPIDILINAAGITRDQTLRKMSREQWDAVLDVNLGSVFNTCKATIDGMCARGYGRIVNISSVIGQTGHFGQTNYAASKAGMHGFTMSLAREVAARGVTANCISPGYVDTPMTRAIREDIRTQIIGSIPVGRIGVPDDIARVVEFLSADDASYITGANIPVNGGMFISF